MAAATLAATQAEHACHSAPLVQLRSGHRHFWTDKSSKATSGRNTSCRQICIPFCQRAYSCSVMLSLASIHGGAKDDYLASHDSPHRLDNRALLNCACCCSRQQRCVQEVVPRRDQRQVHLLTANHEQDIISESETLKRLWQFG